jgi:anti-sigma factor RsiW
MANLFPRTTGLPMVVWVSSCGRTWHDGRIEVSLTPGNMDIGQTAVVGIRPSPGLVEGNMAATDFELVSRWIQANEAARLDFWNETIDSVEPGSRLQKI